MFAFSGRLSARNRLLALWGWFHIALLISALGAVMIDAHGVLGIDPTSKPLRFAISLAMLFGTLARFAVYSLRKVSFPRVYLWRIRILLVVLFLGHRPGGMILYVGLPVVALLVFLIRRRKRRATNTIEILDNEHSLQRNE